MFKCLSLTVDDLDLKNDKYDFILSNLFDVDNDVILSDTYMDGQSYDHTHMKERKVLLQGFVKSKNMSDFLNLRSILFNKKLKKFIINIDGLGEVYFYGEITNWGHTNRNTTVSCQVTIPDSHLYMLNPASVQLGSISGNALTFPFHFPLTFSPINGGQGVVTNVGNCVSYPVITVVGTCSSLTIANTTTGESVHINVALTETDTLVIDNRPTNRGVFLNGVNRMDLKTGLWLSCAVGDNTFTFQRSSVQNKKHCTVELQSAFV